MGYDMHSVEGKKDLTQNFKPSQMIKSSMRMSFQNKTSRVYHLCHTIYGRTSKGCAPARRKGDQKRRSEMPREKKWDAKKQCNYLSFWTTKKKKEKRRETKEAGRCIFYLHGILFLGQNNFTSQNVLFSRYVLLFGSFWKLELLEVLNIFFHLSPHTELKAHDLLTEFG